MTWSIRPAVTTSVACTGASSDQSAASAPYTVQATVLPDISTA